jgi:hypothetical protein
VPSALSERATARASAPTRSAVRMDQAVKPARTRRWRSS